MEVVRTRQQRSEAKVSHTSIPSRPFCTVSCSWKFVWRQLRCGLGKSSQHRPGPPALHAQHQASFRKKRTLCLNQIRPVGPSPSTFPSETDPCNTLGRVTASLGVMWKRCGSLKQTLRPNSPPDENGPRQAGRRTVLSALAWQPLANE